jgi:hypothetical protein
VTAGTMNSEVYDDVGTDDVGTDDVEERLFRLV